MPHEIQQRVTEVRETWNRRATIEVVCWLAAAVVGLLLLAGAIDFGLRIADRGLRVLLSGGLLVAAGYAVWRLGHRWRRRRWSTLSAAQQVQEAYPQLGDRLASSLEFLGQNEDDPSAGSASLRRSVIAGTSAALHDLPLTDVTESPSLRKAMIAAVLAVVVTLGLAIANPSALRTALARVAAPWNNVEWPRQNNLAFVDPPAVVARGETFEASLIDEAGELPGEIRIEYRYRLDGRRRIDEAWMQRIGDRAVARRENVQRPFEYRAVGGDHYTMAWTDVTVVDPPALDELVLTLHPPQYTGLPKSVARGRLQILSGTRLEIAAKANGPLAEALVETPDGEPIACQIRGDARQNVYLSPDGWELTADEASLATQFHLRLVAENELVATTPPTNLRVLVDRPPTVNWNAQTKDEFVVATAAVPVGIAASDDLAIASADLLIGSAVANHPLPGPLSGRGVRGEGGLQEVVPPSSPDPDQPHRISLFRGETDPPARSALPRDGQALDEQSWEHLLDLVALNLAPGAVVELRAEATDYQPAVGTTPAVRRLTIISQAELESRLATDQAEILRRLEQALADQRSARSDSARLATETSAGSSSRQSKLDGLLAVRLQQQNVRQTLTADEQGVIDLANQLLRRIEINRLELPELVSQLENIASEVGELAAGPLPEAEGQLTDLRKRIAALSDDRPTGAAAASIDGSFASLKTAQIEIIETLESLIDAAGKWSDADRFVRELVRLEKEQRELRAATVDAARRQIEALADSNASGVEQAEVERLTAEQADLARRFNKLAQAMRQMASQEHLSSELTDRLNDALAEARASNLAGQMADGAREIEREQLGRAADSQANAAGKLRDLIDLLRDRRPTDPSELAERLRELQNELAQLQVDAAEAAQNGNQQEQKAQRQQLAEQLERLAREMNRMTAPDASRSTQGAASQAAPSPKESASAVQEDMQEAQKQMQKAQQQLAQRIAELEDERQQKLLERLAQVLDDLIPRQQKVLEETLKLEHNRGEVVLQHAGNAGNVAKEEATLAHDLDEAILDIAKRAVFQLALKSAAADMRQASAALEKSDTGRITQGLELGALARMRHVLDVLRDPPPPPDENQEPKEGGGGQSGPKRPPLIELAEVKMLRWLQVDLNGQTRLYEADLADNPQTKASKKQASERLADEQTKLEELVREMMRRNNRTNPAEMDL